MSDQTTQLIRIADALEASLKIQQVREAREAMQMAGAYHWLNKQKGHIGISMTMAKNSNTPQGYQAAKQMEMELERIEHEMLWYERRWPGIREMVENSAENSAKQQANGKKTRTLKAVD